ncbi:hypothetical protein ACOME3_004855 [Neoechinorhynchus agilis]
MSSFSSSDLQLPFFTLELKVLSSSENLSHHIAKSYARLYDGIYSPNFQSDCMEVDRVRQWISSCQMDKDGADLMLQYARYLISIRKRFSLRQMSALLAFRALPKMRAVLAPTFYSFSLVFGFHLFLVV